MKTVIIEDEPLASERLKILLKQYDDSITVIKTLESVEESLKWFSENPPPELLFSDIQLSDGSAFDIFERAPVSAPIIFTTAYDKYALDAFKLTSIDYLLKPVSFESLSNALGKLKKLHFPAVRFTADIAEVFKMLQQKMPHYKSRFTAKIGTRLFFIDTKNVVYFIAENKIVYLTTADHSKYVIDFTLEQLEELLDPSCFFRINRSMIVNIIAISQVKPYDNNRLLVVLKGNLNPGELVVSRERVADFRKWADN